MTARNIVTIAGNEAVSSVAHRTNEVCAIYPITPSSDMGEFADEWSAQGRKNIWGVVPDIVEMQSEAGAAGAVHGSLQTGAITSTFTASQGLLLMIPNMYKIAGEFLPFCMHVSARTLATHALSIFGDHSDVMACRGTGFAMLSSCSVQEAHDMAAIAQAATFETRVPFIHFFEGFRISHEISKMEELTDDDLREMMNEETIQAFRDRALSPDRPMMRGTAQNPDTFFQSREAGNKFYIDCPAKVQAVMDKFAKLTSRQYNLFDYVGAPDADRVIIIMGAGAETTHETVEHLTAAGEKVGLIKVRLYRPFDVEAFAKALPTSIKNIAVLDRTKESGAIGEPLYLDVIAALTEAKASGMTNFASDPVVIGGTYGLSSKDFTPAMVKAVFDELAKAEKKTHFTVGINDDVTHHSLDYDADWDTTPEDVFCGLFFGLGADGTVGANKNSIKIIGTETDNFAQGYFVYDSKKSGAITISHLRFGPRPLRTPYLVNKADFIACHHFIFVDQHDVLEKAADGATFLLNAPFNEDEVWGKLPLEMQQQIIDKKLKVYAINASKVAMDTGMGQRTNTIMQTCFFAISGILPRDEAIAKIKDAIKKTYSRKGEEIVQKNYAAVDASLANLHEIAVPDKPTTTRKRPPTVSEKAPDFMRNVQAVMMLGKGDSLPVSAMPIDGTWPVATTQWEKRNVALDVPKWIPENCIQCNKCSFVCPHGAIRAKVYDAEKLDGAPETFKSVDYKAKDFAGKKFTIQIAVEDCTGCTLCVQTCPSKNKALEMVEQIPIRESERENYDFFLNLPDVDRTAIKRFDVKGSQFLRPLFEYSGACSGCGETAYVKLMTQLFGDRLMVGNATGCSSIYGGNLPTTPYCKDENGRGPVWSNSLFEDNAEYGFGMRLAVDFNTQMAQKLTKDLAPQIGDELVATIINAEQDTEAGINEQRKRVADLKSKLANINDPVAAKLANIADFLVRKSVWVLGGDGWAYDIGFGGIDHVIANQRDINILVLDTEVYSNTGGQASKSTPMGASAKFAAAGKPTFKKDMGLIAMTYGNAYVASVAMGAKDAQTVQAFREAESYNGPSLIFAYSHCIAHGYDLSKGLNQQKMAVDAGVWPLYRFDPRLLAQGKPPLQLDSKLGKTKPQEYMANENRFKVVAKMNPKHYEELANASAQHSLNRVKLYDNLAQLSFDTEK